MPVATRPPLPVRELADLLLALARDEAPDSAHLRSQARHVAMALNRGEIRAIQIGPFVVLASGLRSADGGES